MTNDQLLTENAELRARLEEAEQTLAAIHSGDVDALVVAGPRGDQVFSLTGAETIYRLTVETMAEAALNVAPDGCILFCNARFAEFVRTPLEQLFGRNLDEFIPEADRTAFRALLRQCRQQPIKQRVAFQSPGGASLHAHLTGRALATADGVSLCLVAADLTELENSALQITQLREQQRLIERNEKKLRESQRTALYLMATAVAAQKQAEQANVELRKSEQRIEQALRVSRSFTFEWDAKTDQTLRSDSSGASLGLTGAEAVHDTRKNYFQRIHPDDRARFEQLLLALTPAANNYTTEYRIICPDEREVVLEETGQGEFDAAGRLTRIVGVTTDVTTRKSAEAERTRLSDELAGRIAELQSSLHEKEVLLKEVHHRVKNNLQVISSLVSLQAESLGESLRSGQRSLGQATNEQSPTTHDQSGLRQLTAVFNGLRDQVRAMSLVHDKLYQSESLARIDFAEYAEGLADYIQRIHGSAAPNVRLTRDLHPAWLTIEEAIPCGLILNELTTNALKHAFPAGRAGKIVVKLDTDDTGRMFMGVYDNGVGFPAGKNWRHLPSLGLQLVQMLADQVRGRVECRRPEGGGTEFVVKFEGEGN